MKFRKTSLAVAVSLSVAACGGGGGGGGNPLIRSDSGSSTTYVRSSVPFYTPIESGSFTPLAGVGTSSMVSDIFVQDLNQDSVQEVVIGGRMTAFTDANPHRDSLLQVYGWNSGAFGSETAAWFSGTDNQIKGTEPSIKFADFNGDGHVDMFVAPSTDTTTVYGTATVFLNSGSSSFNRSDIAVGNAWAHDSAVTDVNNDGFADIMVTDYNGNISISLGSAAGTFTTYRQAAGGTGASSVSVADYLGDGTKTVILTDASATGNQDTKLYGWSTVGGNLVLTEVAALPASRFYLAKWDNARAATADAPHEIRNMTYDFNADGRPDVIIFSTLGNPSGDQNYGEVQFLRNDGGGSFTDVTDSLLVNFSTDKQVSYQPRLLDVNKDGILDIFMGSADYVTNSTAYDNSRILLGTKEGKFVESYGSVFRDFWNQISGMTDNAHDQWGQPINVVSGPGGELYLVGSVLYSDNGTTRSKVYLAKIGSSGTVTPEATAAVVNQVWPYLNAVTVNEVLAQTATSFVNGIPVIDLTNVWNPVGGLGISLDGRTGQRIMLAGSISVPGLDRDLLNNLHAVDQLGRNFRVDMSSLSVAGKSTLAKHNLVDTTDITRHWSSRFIDDHRREFNGFSLAGQDISRFSTSISNQHFDHQDPVSYRLGMTRMAGSPWLSFSGVFGQVESSTILDFSASRTWHRKWFVQGGVMQTSTEIKKGLVQAVSPLWAGYAMAGYQDQTWTAFAGLQPTIFAGHIDLKLPTSVDSNGVMHYSSKTVHVRNDAVMFAGLAMQWSSQQDVWRLAGVVDSAGQYQARITYGYKF